MTHAPALDLTTSLQGDFVQGIQLWSGKRPAVRHVNSRGDTKAWESITPTQGPTPKCGSPWRSIKTYGRGNNNAPSITKYGSPVQLDAQIVALRAHCAKGPPLDPMFYFFIILKKK